MSEPDLSHNNHRPETTSPTSTNHVLNETMTQTGSLAATPKKTGIVRRLWTWTKRMIGVLLVLILGIAAFAYWQLRASLPTLSGTLKVTTITKPVSIERDSQGVPTISAKDRNEIAFGLGFAHAQDRLFQMDSMRRYSAGELSGLFGSLTKDVDQDNARFKFRSIAKKVIGDLPVHHRAQIEHYCEGVAAGRASLGSLPFEYHLLRHGFDEWLPEDSVLVLATMAIMLQGDIMGREQALTDLKLALPPRAFEYFSNHAHDMESPIEGTVFPSPKIPTPAEFDLRTWKGPKARPINWHQPIDQVIAQQKDVSAKLLANVFGRDARAQGFLPGSNSWAVGKKLTRDGRAILANDMHLGISLPNTWYRACLQLKTNESANTTAAGAELPARVIGVTLPGAPSMVVGSNGHIAWGFTNTEGDWLDLQVKLDRPQGSATATKEPADSKQKSDDTKSVDSKQTSDNKPGNDKSATPSNVMPSRPSIGGVKAIASKGRGRSPQHLRNMQSADWSFRWAMTEPGGLNFNLLDLMDAKTLEQAIAVCHGSGIPHQNVLIADSAGNIGWTIAGRIPKRTGFALPNHLFGDATSKQSLPAETLASGPKGSNGSKSPSLLMRHTIRVLPFSLISSQNQPLLVQPGRDF